jgi:tetratricopeptide (TPR) repeat protein
MLYQELGRDRQGRMKFGHKYLYDTIETLFCMNKDLVGTCRNLIIDHFEKRINNEDNNTGIILEIAYQLYELRDDERMYLLLLNLENAFNIYKYDRYLVARYASILSQKKRTVSFLGFQRQIYINRKKELVHYWLKEKINKKQRIFIATFCVLVADEYNLALKHFKKSLQSSFSYDEAGEIALIHDGIAKAFRGLGDYEAADNFRNNSARTLSKFDKEKHELNIQLSNLREDFNNNPNDETEKSLLKEMEEAYGIYVPEAAEIYHNIAVRYGDIEKFDKAISFFKKAIDIYEATYSENHAETAESYHNLASIYAQSGNYYDAIKLFEKAEVILKNKYGSNHPELAALYNNLSGFHYLRENYDEALKYGKKAYSIYKLQFGSRAPETVQAGQNVGVVFNKIRACNMRWDL